MCKARNQLALGFSLELFGSWVRVGQGKREWVASKDSLVSLHSGGNWELCLFSPTLLSSIYGPSNIDRHFPNMLYAGTALLLEYVSHLGRNTFISENAKIFKNTYHASNSIIFECPVYFENPCYAYEF